MLCEIYISKILSKCIDIVRVTWQVSEDRTFLTTCFHYYLMICEITGTHEASCVKCPELMKRCSPNPYSVSSPWANENQTTQALQRVLALVLGEFSQGVISIKDKSLSSAQKI